MSNTPRTDENEVEAITGLGRCVGANFARELERENAALRIIRDKAEAILNYEKTGGPSYPDWDALYDSLRDAVEASRK